MKYSVNAFFSYCPLIWDIAGRTNGKEWTSVIETTPIVIFARTNETFLNALHFEMKENLKEIEFPSRKGD